MENNKHHKYIFLDFLPAIILIGMIIFAWIYIEVSGATNADFLYRTADFWIIVSIFAIGYGVFLGSLIADKIKSKEYLELFFLIARGVIIICSVVYWYILQTQMIPITQNMDTQMQHGNYDAVHRLMGDQFSLQQKSTNLSIATMIIVLIFCKAPQMIRWFTNWKAHKNREEDQ